MKTIHLTIIRFPEIQLQTRDAHKLRGYFGNLFEEHSPLLHNHYEDGKVRYRYPLVQYKVIHGIPTLVAVEEGAQLLIKLFLKINQLQLNGHRYPVHSKNIENRKFSVGYTDSLIEYEFQTLWMALNQENYRRYRDSTEENKASILNRLIVGNVLSFFKNMELYLEDHQRLMAKTKVISRSTKFKDQKMMAFSGSFLINAELPDYVGLGKAVSRGFGTIIRI